ALQLPACAYCQFEMFQVPAVAGTVGLARRRFAVLDVDPVVAGATAAGQAMEGRQVIAQRGPADQHLEAGFTGEGEPGLAGRAIATGDGQHTGKQYGEQLHGTPRRLSGGVEARARRVTCRGTGP